MRSRSVGLVAIACEKRGRLSISIAFAVAIALVLLACHPAVGYMRTAQPCHAGGGCDLFQMCVDGYCAVPEGYPFGYPDSGRTSTSRHAAVSDDEGD